MKNIEKVTQIAKKRKLIQTTLPDKWYQELKKYRDSCDISTSEALRRIIIHHFKK